MAHKHGPAALALSLALALAAAWVPPAAAAAEAIDIQTPADFFKAWDARAPAGAINSCIYLNHQTGATSNVSEPELYWPPTGGALFAYGDRFIRKVLEWRAASGNSTAAQSVLLNDMYGATGMLVRAPGAAGPALPAPGSKVVLTVIDTCAAQVAPGGGPFVFTTAAHYSQQLVTFGLFVADADMTRLMANWHNYYAVYGGCRDRVCLQAAYQGGRAPPAIGDCGGCTAGFVAAATAVRAAIAAVPGAADSEAACFRAVAAAGLGGTLAQPLPPLTARLAVEACSRVNPFNPALGVPWTTLASLSPAARADPSFARFANGLLLLQQKYQAARAYSWYVANAGAVSAYVGEHWAA